MTKALQPIKAAPLDPEEEDAFWAGKHPRRILVLPFGGPLPNPYSAKGADLDGQWFHEGTDIYGGYKALRATNKRPVDWHHSYAPARPGAGDPTGKMSGALIGEIELESEPDEDGLWARFWAKAGESRIRLIRNLQRFYGTELFGSSQAIPAGIKANLRTGRIDVWPMVLETITTSPQNTHSVIRPMKALLDDADYLDNATRAFIEAIEQAHTADLAPTSEAGEVAAKAGLDAVATAFDEALRELRER